MDRIEFANRLRDIFITRTDKRAIDSPAQKNVCLALYDLTVIGRHSSANLAKLAEHLHGNDTAPNRDRVRQALNRSISKLTETHPSPGFSIEQTDVSGYRLVIQSMRKPSPSQGLHMGLYAGRTGYIETFRSAVCSTLDRNNRHPILSLHGFGGIGKSTLLEIFRHEASALDMNIKPGLNRDQLVAGSVSDWMSEVFLFDTSENQRPAHKWRDFLDVLEPNTLVFVDTMADVDMTDFNATFSTLSKVLREERSDCLIVTATRDEPHYSLQHLPVDGLTADEIASLSQAPGWPRDVAEHAERLARETDGNPLMIISMCLNEDIWSDYKKGSFDLTKQAEPVTGLLKEMWDGLSEQARHGLSILAALAIHAPRWSFSWDDADCHVLIGSTWPDVKLELTGRRFIRDDGRNGYVVHELISAFAFPRLIDPGSQFKKMSDHFEGLEMSMVATRFLAESERWSRTS